MVDYIYIFFSRLTSVLTLNLILVHVLYLGINFVIDFAENSRAFKKVNTKLVSDLKWPGCEKFKARSDKYWECYVRHVGFTVIFLIDLIHYRSFWKEFQKKVMILVRIYIFEVVSSNWDL